jgi:hypothetical protein
MVLLPVFLSQLNNKRKNEEDTPDDNDSANNIAETPAENTAGIVTGDNDSENFGSSSKYL